MTGSWHCFPRDAPVLHWPLAWGWVISCFGCTLWFPQPLWFKGTESEHNIKCEHVQSQPREELISGQKMWINFLTFLLVLLLCCVVLFCCIGGSDVKIQHSFPSIFLLCTPAGMDYLCTVIWIPSSVQASSFQKHPSPPKKATPTIHVTEMNYYKKITEVRISFKFFVLILLVCGNFPSRWWGKSLNSQSVPSRNTPKWFASTCSSFIHIWCY